MSTVVSKTEHKPSAFASLVAQLGTGAADVKSTSTTVKAASKAAVEALCPELVKGLLDTSGNCYDGAMKYEDTLGEFGEEGAVYVIRPFVKATPAFNQFVLSGFGAGNRKKIEATQKRYIEAQRTGQWSYVGNTCILTVNEAGELYPSGFEQHNCGHSMRATLESGKTILVTFIFGIPKTERDKIDDNQSRSMKDIISTRSEMVDFFPVGGMIEGCVPITDALAGKMQAAVSETFRIVDDIRSGKAAKSGGSRDKATAASKLDEYLPIISKAISLVVALNSKIPYISTSGKTAGKIVTSGGLFKRYSVSHLAAVMTLACSEIIDGKFVWDSDKADKFVEAFFILGNEKIDDPRNPMSLLRMTVDRWASTNVNKGSTGMNVRFNALKWACLLHLNGDEVRNSKFFDLVQSTSGNDGTLNLGGIDDYVDPAKAALKEADDDEETESAQEMDLNVDD